MDLKFKQYVDNSDVVPAQAGTTCIYYASSLRLQFNLNSLRTSPETLDCRRDKIFPGRRSHKAARPDGPCREKVRSVRPEGLSWQIRCHRSRAGNARAT